MASNTESDLDKALAACAREPIQFSGGIQPHGYLISCDAASGVVRHVSANCGALFGIEPAQIIGQPIDAFVHLDLPLQESLAPDSPSQPPEYIATVNIGEHAQYCDVSVHRAQGLAHLEIEPQPHGTANLSAAELVHDMIFRIGIEGDDGERLHALMTEQVHRLTGFDRVMVYRFLPDDTGEVIAESLAEGVQSYLGLRYPASDIPPQARALYLRNRVRVIANTDYTPSPILPAHDADGAPLDLSRHGLRSVSPVHLEYMRNMGMAASMSISIIVDGRLWGLVACHHRTPRQLPPRHRTAADLLGMFYSLRVASAEHLKTAARKIRGRSIRTAMVRALVDGAAPAATIASLLADLREMIPANAAVLCTPEGRVCEGEPVDDATIDAVHAWLARHPGGEVVATHVAADWLDGGDPRYAGVLAMRPDAEHVLLLLRREQVAEVEWAGEPVKHLVGTDDGVRMAPRRSFNTWRETVHGRARPWDADDREDAEATILLLRQALAALAPR